MPFDWDDLRYFMAVIDHGSTKRAAAALKVNQTTCARRITALEASLGFEFFSRESGRYLPTQDALALVEAAKSVRVAADAFAEQAAGRRRAHRSRIRVSSDEVLAATVIVPAVARFSRHRPDVHVEIDVSNLRRDLQAGEADIALRGGSEPDEPGIVRRKLGDDPIGFYCGSTYSSPPQSVAEIGPHPIACLELVRPYLEAAGLGAQVKHVANSHGALCAILTEGDMIGILPASIAHAVPSLRLCFTAGPPTGVWVVYAERLRGRPEVRELSRTIADEFRRRARIAE